MTRVKRGLMAKKKHKKIKKATKGYLKSRQSSIKRAKEAIIKAGQHAYRDRKRKKRTLRQLWILKINAALTKHEISYSKFIAKLKENHIELNRKILAELAEKEPLAFDKIVEKIK